MHKRHGGLWEFPGGKLEPHESWFDAARRELAEELNLRADSVGVPVFAVQDPGSLFVITFVPVTASGEPEPLEHDALDWVTIDELRPLELAPCDQQFAHWLGLNAGKRHGK